MQLNGRATQLEGGKNLWDVIEDANRFRSFLRVDQSQGSHLLEAFKSNSSLADSWQPVDLVLSLGKGEKDKPIADFMSGFVSVAISGKALGVLTPSLLDQAECLPLNTDAGTYFALNVTAVNCLDQGHSTLKLFSNSQRIMRVEKYAFYWEKLNGIHIFRLPELGISRLFVSDTFKQAVEENSLTGLLFYPVPLSD